MKSIIIGVAIWAACSGLTLAQDDAEDPAITVCEHVLKSTLRSPKSYERVSASIQGERVRIEYDAVNVYNAPLRERHTCSFRLGEDGKYSLYDDTIEKQTAEINGLRQELEAKPLPSRERLATIKDRIDEIVQSIPDLMLSSLTLLNEAKATGLVPLDPASTALLP